MNNYETVVFFKFHHVFIDSPFSHLFPTKPTGHLQNRSFPLSQQVAPLRQEDNWHLSLLISQWLPWYPLGHMHPVPFSVRWHLPPFKQIKLAQLSVSFISQQRPEVRIYFNTFNHTVCMPYFNMRSKERKGEGREAGFVPFS